MKRKTSRLMSVLAGLLCMCILFCGQIAAAEPAGQEQGGTSDAAAPRINQNFDFNVQPTWRTVTSDNNLFDQVVTIGVTDFAGTLEEVEVKLVAPNGGSQTAILGNGESVDFFNYWDAGTWKLLIRSTTNGYGYCHIWIQD